MHLFFEPPPVPRPERRESALQTGPLKKPIDPRLRLPRRMKGIGFYDKEIQVMAKFCGSCGAQLSDATSFCIQCGTAQNASATQAQPPAPAPTPAPAQNAYAQVNVPPAPQPGYAPVNAPPPAQYAPVNPGAPPSYPPAPVAKGSGSGLKIVLGILAVLFVGGLLVLGGLFYIGHRVVSKIKTAAAENGLSIPSSSESEAAAAVTHGDPCALLSKEDVGSAIGVPIVATRADGEEGCEYLAAGTQADMTARHMSAMMAARGADSQTQDKIHEIAGGFFKNQQQASKEQTLDVNGTVPVVVFSIDTNGAREQMQLNSKVLGVLGPTGSTALAGIGDEAFDSSGGMMFVRKGDKLIRITYLTCPCNTEAIKPLARKLADAI